MYQDIDRRKMRILSAVVDEYIKTGEPIGSHAVQKNLGMEVSTATIRNDMAALEKLGFLEQPHTSAGRVPTYLGYRFYIDRLMSPKQLTSKEKKLIDSLFCDSRLQTMDVVVEKAADVLSDLTQLAVVSKNNIPVFSVITRVEVIPAGRRLYALLVITSAGTVSNKICRIEFDLTNEQLAFFAKFANENLTGVNIERLTPAMLQNLAVALGAYMLSLSPLLHAVYELSEQMSHSEVNLKGERKLLSSGDLNSDDVVELLTRKNELDTLLSSAFDGVSIVFGKENQSLAITNSSMILSHYEVNGMQGGSLGVIGPIRVDYAKVIPHIEYISSKMTKLLSSVIEDELEDRKEEIDG